MQRSRHLHHSRRRRQPPSPQPPPSYYPRPCAYESARGPWRRRRRGGSLLPTGTGCICCPHATTCTTRGKCDQCGRHAHRFDQLQPRHATVCSATPTRWSATTVLSKEQPNWINLALAKIRRAGVNSPACDVCAEPDPHTHGLRPRGVVHNRNSDHQRYGQRATAHPRLGAGRQQVRGNTPHAVFCSVQTVQTAVQRALACARRRGNSPPAKNVLLNGQHATPDLVLAWGRTPLQTTPHLRSFFLATFGALAALSVARHPVSAETGRGCTKPLQSRGVLPHSSSTAHVGASPVVLLLLTLP